jgi:uncharacterized protein YukE
MGSAMAQATIKTGDIVKTLDNRVDTLADDAQWAGDAAEAFRKVWSRNAKEVGFLNASATTAGTTIKALGDALQHFENTLHDTADEYSSKGVPIGPNGEPQAVVVQGDASASPAKDVLQAANEYKELYDSTLILADNARIEAANNLSDLLDHYLLPADAKPDRGVKPDVRATGADYIRGLLTAPNEQVSKGDEYQKELSDARQRFKATRKPLQAAKADYAAKGLCLPATNDAHLAHSKALQALNEAADKVGGTSIPKWVLPGSEWLNVKMSDLVASGSLLKAVPKQLGFLKNVPVLDVLAGGIVGTVQAQDDIGKGRGSSQAYLSDMGASAAGIGAGAAVIALAPEAAPALAVAAGVGSVGVLVGNMSSSLAHEHWMEDIHGHGVVAGLADGVGNSVWGGVKDTGTQIKDIWHGIFG